MIIEELNNFYDAEFMQCFRAYFLEIGIDLKGNTAVFDDIAESYEKEEMRTFVIREKGGIVGFIMIQPECLKSGFFEEHAGFIRELWISPPSRRLGYGKQLIERAEEYFRGKGISKLILTYEENALPFYKRLGFDFDCSYSARNGENVVIKHF